MLKHRTEKEGGSMDRVLYYVADPMCSWCWGFHPVLEKVKEVLPDGISPVYVMGGLARDSG